MIKKRWKASAILLAWLVLFWYYFNEFFFGILGLLTLGVPDPYSLIEAKILYFIAPLFLTWLFLLSMHKTEEKILSNTFTYGCLKKNYFGVTLLCYLGGVLLFIPNIYQLAFHGAGLELGALMFVGAIEIWVVLIPFITLVVWLLPAFLFYKFYFQPKIFRIFSVVSLILLLIFSITAITMKSTCHLGSDEDCVLSKAIKANNIPLSLCERMKNEKVQYSCYSFASKYFVDSGNFKDCYNLPAESQRRSCIMKIAVKTEDATVCDKLEEEPSSVSGDTRGRCYEAIAVEYRYNGKGCDNLPGGISNTGCLISLAGSTKDPRICFQLGKIAYDKETKECLQQALSMDMDILMDQEVFDYYMTRIQEDKSFIPTFGY